MRTRTVVLAGAALLCAVGAAGQSAPKPAAQAATPGPIKIGSVTLSGSLRTRVEAWDWFEGEANNSYPFLGSILRLSLGQTKKAYDWQVEIGAPLLLGLPDDAIAAGTQGQLGLGATYFAANDRNRNTGMVFIKQGYLRFKGLGGHDGQSLRIGRMEFIDGNEVAPKNPTLAAVKRDRIAHRLLGNFGFTHVGRSFDGAQYGFNTPKLNLTLIGGRPTRGVFQTDGWGELKVNVYYGALTGQVGGKTSAGEWRVFGLGYNDLRDGVLKTDNRVVAVRRADTAHLAIGTFGGHYLHAATVKTGTFDVMFWGALQAGSWGALSHRAGAFAAEAGFQPAAAPKLKPWIRGGFNYASGDKSAGDTKHGTFFQVLPTPRIYARMPFFNLMNSSDVFGELILRPGKALTLRGDVHALRLADKNDLWYLGGGAFQPWSFGFVGRASTVGKSGLATLYDLSADYNVNARLLVSGYVGHAAGGAVAELIYPKGKSATFGYLEFTWRF